MDTQRLRELLDRRDAIDAEIAEIVTGNAKPIRRDRAEQKCSQELPDGTICGSTEHNKQRCPHNPKNKKTHNDVDTPHLVAVT